jgi:outer membrane protein
VTATGVFADTLGDALAKAYLNSGLLAQNRALLHAANEDVASAVASLRPILSYSASIDQQDTYLVAGSPSSLVDTSVSQTTATLALTGSLTIYNFGSGRMGVDAAKESVLATREALRGIEQTVLLNAVSAYMQVQATAQIVNLQENNLRVLTEELRAARERFEVGEITRTDVALAEASVASSRSDLVAAQGDLTDAQAFYIAVTGELSNNINQPGKVPSVTSNLAEALEVAMRKHPDIIEAQHNIKIAKAAMMPSVDLTASASKSRYLAENSPSYDEGRETTTGSLGIEVSGPIYRGGALASSVRRAQANRDANRAALHVAQLTVEQSVRTAFAALREARAASVAADELIRANTVAFQGVREEASLGARTTLDVLDAEQDLLDARAVKISANAQEYIQAYSLLSAMGLLDADYLNLNVPRYDVEAQYNLVKNAPPAISIQGEKLQRILGATGKK